MRRVREALLLGIVAAIVLHVIASLVSELLPYFISGLAVVCIVGTIYHRRRW